MSIFSCLSAGLRKVPLKTAPKNLSPVNQAKATLTGAMKKTTSKKVGTSKDAIAQTDKYSSQHKLGYKDKVTDGFTMSAPSDPTVTPKNLLKERVHTSVNLKKDPALKKWIDSPEVAQLKKGPQVKSNATATETVVAERNYLNGVSDFINKSFGKLDANTTTHLYRDLKAKPPGLKEKMSLNAQKLFSKKSDGLTHKLRGSEVPLGTNIEVGAGMCRHQALSTKVLFDQMGNNTMSAKLIGGKFNSNTVQGQHAWNKIKMPSGNKYLFDASTGNVKLSYSAGLKKKATSLDKMYQKTPANQHLKLQEEQAKAARLLKELDNFDA